MKELVPVRTQNLEEKRQIWRKRTLNCLDCVEGDVARAVEEGIIRGLAFDSEEGRKKLALSMADILALVVSDNGEEKFLEDLEADKNEIADEIGTDSQTLERIFDLMVDYKFIKKRKREEN